MAHRSHHLFSTFQAAIGLLILALALLGGCSLTLDLQACTEDDDCAGGLICSEDNLCQESAVDGCTGDEDCDDGYYCGADQRCIMGGASCQDSEDCDEGFVCGPDDRCIDSSAQCQIDADCEEIMGSDGVCNNGLCEGPTDLTGGPCQRLYGPVGEDDVFLVGAVLQLSGVGAGFGQPMLDSMRIAKRDINGIGGVDGRKIGIIACDTEGRDSIARDGANHLIDVGVSSIIGMNSSQVIDIGPSTTVPAEVLLMSPSATATTISNLNDNNLIWRTAPSDEAQSIALAGLINHVVETVLPARGIEEPKVTLLVRNQDRWATGHRDHLSGNLNSEITSGGNDRFSIHNFDNVGAGDPADYTGTAADVAAEEVAPDLVVVLGSADSWTIIDHLEVLLDNEPLYIGGDAMKNAAEAEQANADLENRIWGTGPLSVAEIGYEPYSIFRLKFLGELNDEPNNYQFVANAFDAMYAVAFAAASGGFTGPEIAEGLANLSDGNDIDPRSSDAQQAIQTLSGGGSINYRGASGPLNFNESGDPEPMPIALWCFQGGTVPEIGELYSEESGFVPLTCDQD